VNLYQVETRDEDTTGWHGSYTSIIRAKSHKDAALYLVRGEIEAIRDELEANDDVGDCLGMTDDIAVMEIPSAGADQEGYVGGDWQEFSLDALVNEIEP
jgi:hypothetical protein